MLDRVEEVLDDLGLAHLRLDGLVPSDRRGELIARFSDDARFTVLTSTDAGGVGLNLQCASAIVSIELPWNPAKLAQRVGRIHRLGQERDVEVHLLVGDGFEEKVEAGLAHKTALFRAAIPNAA